MSPPGALEQKLKRLIVERLKFEGLDPEGIDDDMSLFDGGLDLDSVDVLELVVAVEKEFAISVRSQEVGRRAFQSVRSLAKFVREHQMQQEPAP